MMKRALSAAWPARGYCVSSLGVILLLISSGLSSSCSAPVMSVTALDKSLAAQARVRLGLAYLAQGELSLAWQNFEQALRYQPRSASAHGAMALYQQQTGEPQAAQYHHQRALQLDPGNGELLHHYARFLCDQQRYPEAQHYFTAALQAPGYTGVAESLYQAGCCYLRAAQPVAARDRLRRSLQHQPRQGARWITAASQALQAGRIQESFHWLEIYDALQPASAESLWLHIRLAARAGATAAVEHYGARLRREFPAARYCQQLADRHYELASD